MVLDGLDAAFGCLCGGGVVVLFPSSQLNAFGWWRCCLCFLPRNSTQLDGVWCWSQPDAAFGRLCVVVAVVLLFCLTQCLWVAAVLLLCFLPRTSTEGVGRNPTLPLGICVWWQWCCSVSVLTTQRLWWWWCCCCVSFDTAFMGVRCWCCCFCVFPSHDSTDSTHRNVVSRWSPISSSLCVCVFCLVCVDVCMLVCCVMSVCVSTPQLD